MSLSRRSTSIAIAELRRTIDCLPIRTRQAMLEGIRRDRIIVGAYTDSEGGVCPMLSAHRRGGRTSFLAFARTWDRFTKAPSRGSRPATPRELRILEHHLEASIAAAEEGAADVSLRAVVAEHQALRRRRSRADASLPSFAEAIAAHRASSDRTAVEQEHEGAAAEPRRRGERRRAVPMPEWLRPMGSIEDYERALEEVDVQRVRLGLVGDTSGPSVERRKRERAGAR